MPDFSDKVWSRPLTPSSSCLSQFMFMFIRALSIQQWVKNCDTDILRKETKKAGTVALCTIQQRNARRKMACASFPTNSPIGNTQRSVSQHRLTPYIDISLVEFLNKLSCNCVYIVYIYFSISKYMHHEGKYYQ